MSNCLICFIKYLKFFGFYCIFVLEIKNIYSNPISVLYLETADSVKEKFKLDKTENKKDKKFLIIVIIVLIAAVVAVVGIVVCNTFFSQKESEKSSDGVVGVISPNWQTGIDESTAPPNGVQIPGYAAATMNAGDMSLHLSVGNPESNKCGFYATLKLKDDTVLYESELLKPGYGLTDVPLNKTLEKGEYDAMVVYQCVTLDEKETPLNAAESEFKLIVK